MAVSISSQPSPVPSRVRRATCWGDSRCSSVYSVRLHVGLRSMVTQKGRARAGCTRKWRPPASPHTRRAHSRSAACTVAKSSDRCSAVRAAADGYSSATSPSLGWCLRDSSSSVVVSASCQCLDPSFLLPPPPPPPPPLDDGGGGTLPAL